MIKEGRFILVGLAVISFIAALIIFSNPFGILHIENKYLPYMLFAVSAICIFLIIFKGEKNAEKRMTLEEAKKLANEYIFTEYKKGPQKLIKSRKDKNKFGETVWDLDYKTDTGSILHFQVSWIDKCVTESTKEISTTPSKSYDDISSDSGYSDIYRRMARR